MTALAWFLQRLGSSTGRQPRRFRSVVTFCLLNTKLTTFWFCHWCAVQLSLRVPCITESYLFLLCACVVCEWLLCVSSLPKRPLAPFDHLVHTSMQYSCSRCAQPFPPSYMSALICDNSHHIFFYRDPSPRPISDQSTLSFPSLTSSTYSVVSSSSSFSSPIPDWTSSTWCFSTGRADSDLRWWPSRHLTFADLFRQVSMP